MQKKYKWKGGSRYSGKVSIVGVELEKIQARHNGIATPKDVLKAAKNKKSPLHRYFEWDDTTAAEQWRLEQAGNLVRSIEVVCGDSSQAIPTRAYVSIEKNGKRGYMEISDVMTDPELRDQLLAQALNDAESFQSKYKTLTELKPVFAAIESVKKSTVNKREEAA